MRHNLIQASEERKNTQKYEHMVPNIVFAPTFLFLFLRNIYCLFFLAIYFFIITIITAAVVIVSWAFHGFVPLEQKIRIKIIWSFCTWCPLKGHRSLNKPAAFSYRFV